MAIDESGVDRLPVIRQVPLADLKVDHAFQRELNEGWVGYLYDNYQPEALGTMVVSLRADGSLVALDGQHRIAMLRRRQGDHLDVPRTVKAEVFEGLSLDQEATLFLKRNDRKAVGTIDQWKARIVAGDSVACRVDAILRAHGACWDTNNHHGYTCVVMLEKAHQWGVLDSTIGILEGAWPNGEHAVYKHRRQMVEGTAIFVLSARARSDYEDGLAIDRFQRRINPNALLNTARNEALATSVNQSVIVARRLRDAYNRNSKRRIPEIIPPKGYRG